MASAAAVQLVEYPNGAVAPAKTLEVQAAEAAHFAAKGQAYAPYWNGAYNGLYNGAWNGAGYNGAWNGAAYNGAWNGYNGAWNGAWNGAYQGAWNGAYNGAYGYPGQLVAYANGAIAPQKTPAVLQAEAEHFAAHGIAPVAPFAYAAGYHGLVGHANGALVPVEPADVVAARAEHLAAHAAA